MNRKQYIITGLVAIALIIAVYFLLFQGGQSDQDAGSDQGVNYDPPTEEQKQAGDTKKEQAAEDDASSNQQQNDSDGSDPENKKKAVVVLTRAQVDDNLVTVAGYAESSVSGNCRLTLTSAGAQRLMYTNETSFNPTNPNNVDCNTFRIKRSELNQSNSWTAQIRYTAPGYEGTSNSMEIQL